MSQLENLEQLMMICVQFLWQMLSLVAICGVFSTPTILPVLRKVKKLRNGVATFDAELEVSDTVISLLDQGGQKNAERKDENAKYARKFKSFVAGLIGSRYDWSYCLVFFAVAIFIIIVGRALGSYVPYPDELVNETQDDMISARDPSIDAVTSVTSTTLLATTNPMIKLMQKELPPEEVESNKRKTMNPTHFPTSVPTPTTISHDDILQTEDYITN